MSEQAPENKPTYREMDERTKRLVSAFLPRPAPLRIPVTPPGFGKLDRPPVYFIGPYSEEARARRASKDGNSVQKIRELFKEGTGLLGADTYDYDGNPVPFDAATFPDLLSGAAVLWLDEQILILTLGPTDAEREALG